MAMAEKTDWKVWATLDRKALAKDIAALEAVLEMKKVYCVVSAADKPEAHAEALRLLETVEGIPRKYIKVLRPRRLPT